MQARLGAPVTMRQTTTTVSFMKDDHESSANTTPTSQLDKAATLHGEAGFRWAAAARHRRIKVVVLGGSVSAGCGTIENNRACSTEFSWVRKLASMLSATDTFEVQVWARNAVFPEYFSHCTQEYIGNADVVILEFQPNMQVSSQGCQLYDLVDAIRRHRSTAAILVAGWPSQSVNMLTSAYKCDYTLKKFAAAVGSDLVLASALFARCDRLKPDRPQCYAHTSKVHMSRAANSTHPRGLLPRREGRLNGVYADDTHPGTEGAALFAQTVARVLLRRLYAASCPGTRTSHPAAAVISDQVMNNGGARAGNLEWCLRNVSQLPASGGWRLVDEGGEKLVQKLGLLSTRVNQTLTINASAILGRITCGFLMARLTFLVGWAPHHGAFSIGCAGSCVCRPIRGIWASGSDPYPVVNTHRPDVGATVTASTRFIVEIGSKTASEMSECLIHIQHISSSQRSAHRPHELHTTPSSRVRIDGIGFSQPDCHSGCDNLLTHGGGAANVARRLSGLFSWRCGYGQARGRVGHVGPSCFANASTAEAAMRVCTTS